MVSLETRLKRHLLLGVLLVGLVLAVAVRTKVHRQQSEMLDYQLEQVARALILSDLQGTAHPGATTGRRPRKTFGIVLN